MTEFSKQELNRVIKSEYFKHVSPSAIYDTLSKMSQEDREFLLLKSNNNSDDLVNHLLNRNDPLINLSIALYTTDTDVLRTLYDSGSKELRIACLRNNWFHFENDFIKNILLGNNDDEKCAVLTNDQTGDVLLYDLFSKEGIFENLSEDDWYKQIKYASENKFMSEEPEKYDGLINFFQRRAYRAAWSLIITVPTTSRWSNLLIRLLWKAPKETDINIEDAIKRWKILDKNGKDEFIRLREQLADLYYFLSDKFKNLLTSDDIALRKSYYKRVECVINCNNPSLLQEYYQKDKKEFITSAIENDNFFKTKEFRSALRSIIFEHFDSTYLHYFDYRIKYLKSKHPRWFKEKRNAINPFRKLARKLELVLKEVKIESNEAKRELRNLKFKISLYFTIIVVLIVYMHYINPSV